MSAASARGVTTGPEEFALRAGRAYAVMQERFCSSDGTYRRRAGLRWPGSAEHLWPMARAFVATLDLTGVASGRPLGIEFDSDHAIAARLGALERYWKPDPEPPAYSSDIVGTRIGGDRYYDDNAWVGLGLVELERLRPGAAGLDRAAALFRFALSGRDLRTDGPAPGGVFWVEQGRGLGARNHDRNTVSAAPNAELGLHLAELAGAAEDSVYVEESERMVAWVQDNLAEPGGGLYFDKLRGDGTIDRARWSYNQGSMIGAYVLLARRPGAEPGHLARAEAIARRALGDYAETLWDQPPAFNAIFFRNLLLLHAATADGSLRAAVTAAARGYAERLWRERRSGDDLVGFRGRPTLLDQSAVVQLCALLAWDPADYAKLA